MAVKIRLARGGAKKRPYYRIVVADARSPRDGKFIERVGSYNPILPSGHAERVVLDEERVRYWLGVGAQPTDRVTLFLSEAKIIGAVSSIAGPKQAAPKAKAQERLKEREEKAKAAAEAAAAPAPVAEPATEEAPAAEAVAEEAAAEPVAE